MRPIRAKPVASTYLDSRPMWDPWESLKVNVPRKLLAAVQADGGNGVDPGFAVYDISDCARPVLKAAVNLPAAGQGTRRQLRPRRAAPTTAAQHRREHLSDRPSTIRQQPKLLGRLAGADQGDGV